MTSAITPETVFLVSGGAKGITAQCVIELARRYQCRFALVGRSRYADGAEPDWAQGAADDAALKQRAMAHLRATGERPTPQAVQRMARDVRSHREIAGTLRAIAAAGGRAAYVRADVTDRDALRAGVAGAEAQLGPVTGIIHGAGVLADKRIERKTAEDFERVVGVKVRGLRHLLDCVPPDRLRWLVLFSSVAGVYGNVGQADYALANEALNKVAHRIRRRHPHVRALAVDWGPWDGGMVTPALKRQLAARGIAVIPNDVGPELLADLLAAPDGAPQVVVGSAISRPACEPDARPQAYRIHRTLRLADNAFLYDHVIGGHAVLPTVCAVAWVANAAEQLYPGYRFFRAQDYKALKGIVFDATLADDYVLTLERVDGDGDADAVTLDAMIASQTPEGRPRYHYSVRVTLRRTLPDAPHVPSVDLAEAQPLDGAALYQERTLFHGPSFQGVDRVLRIGPAGLTMRCRLPEVPAARQGQFPVQTFNPYLTDVQLQSLLIWAQHTYGYGGLPLRIAGGEQYRPAPFDAVTYATLEVREHTPRRLVADVTVHDAEGRLYSRVTGAEITLSERMTTLFQDCRLAQEPAR
jgi:NAD(P)-dependent dehydrogenase (short-subunit alcohol dehydrogenase family)